MGRPAYSEEEVETIRQGIRDHALRLLRRHGYRDVTLRQIATEMGWTPAALYRYFGSKDEIFASIRAEGFARIREILKRARDEAPSPLEAVRGAARAYFEFALGEPETFRVLYELDQGEMAASAEVKREREAAFSVARELAADAVEAGVFEGDPNRAAHLLWVACHGLLTLELAHQLDLGCSFDELVDPVLDALIRAAPSSAAPEARAPRDPERRTGGER